MNIFNKAYLKLGMVCITFTCIFYLFCSIMIDYILNSNMKIVCDVYYGQVSTKIKGDIAVLESANEYLAKNEVIIDYLIKAQNGDLEDLKDEREEVLGQVKNVENILNSISFVDTVNIVDLKNKYLFSEGKEVDNFDITARPWYNEKFFSSRSYSSQITEKHQDYSTGKKTVSIVSLIYDDKDTGQYFKPIGAVILDIYVSELLDYIDSSFYSGVLTTEIYPSTTNLDRLKYNKNQYNLYINQSILNNGEHLVFKFDKTSLVNESITASSLQKMRVVLLLVGIVISFFLFIAIRISFRSTLMSIDKLKAILGKLNKNNDFIEDKNEFRQLEKLADSLNKSFDEKIQELIYFDELTGLPNRKMLEYTCEQLIEEEKPFALIFIDLNKFKYINDVFGHIVGDEYLIKFSQITKDVLKDKGLVTRYSGDEFIIVYKDYTDEKELVTFYNEKFLNAFSAPIQINEKLLTEIGFSAGVSLYPKDGKDFEELISRSDFMMYINKKNFVNRKVAFFDEQMYETLMRSERIKAELETALKDNEFYLNYQPIVDKDAKAVKAETLLRWNNKNLGFIPPDQFIKHLEETREIINVGYWIIEKVCQDIEDVDFNKLNFQVNINISPLQLMLKDFVPKVMDIVEKYKIPYRFLCFEITENVLLDNRQFVLTNIDKLRDLGIKIALDDFGTGYSSFKYLRSYKLDSLKIDRSFLKGNEKLDFDIINQIKELAHLLGLEVVVEGVETKTQFEAMKKINIDYLQGYYFSKPIPFEEFKKMLISE